MRVVKFYGIGIFLIIVLVFLAGLAWIDRRFK